MSVVLDVSKEFFEVEVLEKEIIILLTLQVEVLEKEIIIL